MGSPMPPATSVPFPAYGPNGFTVPDESAILTGALADNNAAFGGNLNPALNTPQGQLASSETAIVGDSFAMFLWFVNNVDPAYSSGRMQDAIGRIYFISRIAGSPTVQPVLCSGLTGVVIPQGTLLQDQSGNLWLADTTGTVDSTGATLINFSCQDNGPVAPPVTLSIYQNVFGFDNAAPSGDAVLGRTVESASQFEYRRALSTGLNSMGPLNAVYAAVAQLIDVLDVYTTQNNTNAPATIGGVSIGANSIYVCVLGGTATEVAQAIYTRKMPGCGMTGNTTVAVPDPNPAYQPPVPTINITFQVPMVVPFSVLVTITNSSAVPSDAATQVDNAVVAAFAGLDGGPRAKIGSLVYASRYYAPVSALGNTFNGATGQVLPGWSAPIVSILVGRHGAAGSVTGAITGSTLTVSSVASGVVAVGQLVEGSGVLGGTLITALAGGTGGTGNYTVNFPQTALSEPIALTTLQNDVQTNINEAPGVSAANVYLNLS